MPQEKAQSLSGEHDLTTIFSNQSSLVSATVQEVVFSHLLAGSKLMGIPQLMRQIKQQLGSHFKAYILLRLVFGRCHSKRLILFSFASNKKQGFGAVNEIDKSRGLKPANKRLIIGRSRSQAIAKKTYSRSGTEVQRQRNMVERRSTTSNQTIAGQIRGMPKGMPVD